MSSFPELGECCFICHELKCSTHLHSSIVYIFLLLPGLAGVPEMIPLTMLNGFIFGGIFSQKLLVFSEIVPWFFNLTTKTSQLQ